MLLHWESEIAALLGKSCWDYKMFSPRPTGFFLAHLFVHGTNSEELHLTRNCRRVGNLTLSFPFCILELSLEFSVINISASILGRLLRAVNN